MKLINEARRMQQLAGLINENYVDLGAINSPFMESEEMNEAPNTREIDQKIQTDKDFLEKVKEATAKAEKGDTSDLADLLGSIIKPFKEAKEDDDMDDVESDEEELDYFSNKPGKRDEFDTDDDIEPAAKDVTAGDDLAKLTGSKQAKLNALTKIKDELFAKWKNKELSTDEYVQKITKYKTKDGKEMNIQQQIKNLQADIDRDLSIDDEEEI